MLRPSPNHGIQRLPNDDDDRPPQSIFERLDDEGIVVDEALQYYPYRATFDLECYFDKANIFHQTVIRCNGRHDTFR